MSVKRKFVKLFFLIFFLFLIINAYVITLVDKNFNNFFDTLYWEVVTISTVGYGDITPSTPLSKILTVILIIYGVTSIAIFSAYITAYFVTLAIEKLKGWKVLENVNNHLLICGYNYQTNLLIKTFIQKNLFESEKIVLIHSQLTPEIENILEEYKIKFVEGDYSEEETLKKAKVHVAKRAVLVSESLEDDAKILSSVILLKSMNKDIYIVAEIINSKFRIYLKKVKCDEIILSKDYNSYLMTKSTLSPGISKVIESMLVDENFYITRYHGKPKTFGEIFQEHLNKNELLIGIIENYAREGEFIKEFVEDVKREIKRVGEIAKYLEEVKHKELNKVILSPSQDYKVNKFCGLIILRRENEKPSDI